MGATLTTVLYVVTRTIAGKPDINTDAHATGTEIRNQRGEGSKIRGFISTSRLTPKVLMKDSIHINIHTWDRKM